MTSLERLFFFEVEFHRRLRTEANLYWDAGSLHTSYALQSGYEMLLKSLGTVTATDIEALAMKHVFSEDTRDVLKAKDSVMELLGISPCYE